MLSIEIKMARKTKGKTLLKRKLKDLKRKDAAPRQMNQLVTVTEIHKRLR